MTTNIGIIASAAIGGGELPPPMGVPTNSTEIPFLDAMGNPNFIIDFSGNLVVSQYDNYSNGGVIFSATGNNSPIVGGVKTIQTGLNFLPPSASSIWAVTKFTSATASTANRSQVSMFYSKTEQPAALYQVVELELPSIANTQLQVSTTQYASTGPVWPTGCTILYVGYT